MNLHSFSFSFYRLACDWSIQYYASEERTEIKGVFLKHIDDFCHHFSRFDEDSELSLLNKNRQMKMSERFWKLFEKADFYDKKTDGIFNALASPAHFGYTHDFDSGIFTQTSSNSPNFNWQDIKRTEDVITLSPGQLLDFGGLGKGYLIDELSDIMNTYSQIFLINGGGDLRVAGIPPDDSHWKIAIESPIKKDISAVIALQDGAVASSGTTEKKWEQHHHLIDTKNIQPAQRIPKSLTVIADNCCLADVAATTLICLDPQTRDEMARRLGVEYGFFEQDTFYSTSGFAAKC